MPGRSLTSLCLSLPPPVLPEVDKHRQYVLQNLQLLSILLLVLIVFSLVFQKKLSTIVFTMSVVTDATKCLHMVNAPWLLWLSLEGKVL